MSLPRWAPLAGRWLLILALLFAGIGTPLAPVAAQAPLPAVAAPPAALAAEPPPLAPDAAGTAVLPETTARPATAPLAVSPTVAGIELALAVAPEAVWPGETVTLTVALTNPPSGQAYERLVLVSELPAGILPVPQSGNAEIVPGPHPALRWELTGLAVGTTWQGSAQVRLTGRVIDRDVPLAVEAREAAPAVSAWAHAWIGGAPPPRGGHHWPAGWPPGVLRRAPPR